MDLLGIIRDNPALIGQVASQLGIDEGDARRGIEQLVPSVGRGLRNNAAQPGGIDALEAALSKGQHARYLDEPAALGTSENLADGSPSPLEETVGNEALARYEAALTRLPELDQEVVMLRLELGFSYSQVAEAVGSLSPNAARMRVVRAVMRLAEELT